MEQSKADVWTVGTIPTVTSAFRLLLIDGHSPSIDADPFLSRRCGLGWVYNIQATSADITQSSSGNTESGKRTMFTISFATPRIATTNLNKLSVVVKAPDRTSASASKITIHTADIPLPVTESIHLASILSVPNFTGNIAVHITIRVELPVSVPPTSVPPTFEHAFREPTPPNSQLHSAIAQSLLGEEIDDVKFGLFTRRGGNDVTDLNIIFASSSLLHGHNAFLINLLSDDNSEREVVTAGDLATQVYSTYDYMSDSDLESDYDPETDDSGDLDSQVPSLLGTEPFTTRSLKEVRSGRRKLEDNEKVILIRDTAFATWKALVFYSYTRQIHFKPLTSSGSSQSLEASNHDVICSPKSMYRLATKIGSEELRSLSLEAIVHGISENNIVEELFSHFTSMYPEVQKAEVEALIPLLKQSVVVGNLLCKMRSVVTRGLPHCSAIVEVIMGRVVELAVQG